MGRPVTSEKETSIITVQDVIANKDGRFSRPVVKSPRFIAAVRAQRLLTRQRQSEISQTADVVPRSEQHPSHPDTTAEAVTPFIPVSFDSPPPLLRRLQTSCRRAQSAVTTASHQTNRQSESSHISNNDLSRQCCDVLGPSLCHECARILRRENDIHRHEASYQDLPTSSQGYSTTVMVKRYIPHMAVNDIQHKIARGDISRSVFGQWLTRIQANAQEEKEHQTKVRSKISNPFVFFRGINDLNDKYISGHLTRKQILLGVPKDSLKAKSVENSYSEKVYPMFVSPRKVVQEKPRYFALFDPPLLPKIHQDVEPSFFAGSDKPYKLPERLPEDRVPEEAF